MLSVKSINRNVRTALLSAVVGSVAAGLLYSTIDSVHAQAPTKLKWVLTAQVITPTGRPIYRFEDPDLKIICYAKEDDFSGGFACVKR